MTEDPCGSAFDREVLAAFDHECEENDWVWAMAWNVLGGHDLAKGGEGRKAIKRLREKGLLRLCRGGTDEMGDVVGGSGYGLTITGHQALRWSPQQELAL